MTREEKLTQIKAIQSGGKIGDLLNFGIWLWTRNEIDGIEELFNQCETPFNGLKIALKDFSAYCDQIGGTHLVLIKTYSSPGAGCDPDERSQPTRVFAP